MRERTFTRLWRKKMDKEETKREKQVREACEKAVRTGKRKDLADYLRMRRE